MQYSFPYSLKNDEPWLGIKGTLFPTCDFFDNKSDRVYMLLMSDFIKVSSFLCPNIELLFYIICFSLRIWFTILTNFVTKSEEIWTGISVLRQSITLLLMQFYSPIMPGRVGWLSEIINRLIWSLMLWGLSLHQISNKTKSVRHRQITIFCFRIFVW